MFDYTEENLKILERYLSAPRLKRYVKLANGDFVKSLELYAWNISLSEAILAPLSILEVALRNAIHERLSLKFGSTWYESTVVSLENIQHEQLLRTKKNLKQSFTPDQLIAELNFGFWVGLLGNRYEMSFWRPYLHSCFPYLPKGKRRKDVHKALNIIRDLRNRVAHHEPILERNIEEDYRLILDSLSWIHPTMSLWANDHSRVLDVLKMNSYRGDFND